MKTASCRIMLLLAVAMSAEFALAQKPATLAADQTYGYGAGKLLKFTYTQAFDCVDQPNADLNFNSIKAAADPGEFQVPICQVGTQPSINPPGQLGNPANTTEPLYILVPMFSVDDDQNPNDAISCDGVVAGSLCGPQLGSTLIGLFGSLPEAFKAKPLVYTQCPDPGLPPGTCTMHASRVDLGPALEALGLLPPPVANVFTPTPNHSHIVINADINIKAIWWQVIPVLVFDQTLWPNEAGTTGLTSRDALVAAEKAGQATEVPSNFFLFFSSYTTMSAMHK
jgi:hypothetical protein